MYQYWNVAETRKKGRSAPQPCTVYKKCKAYIAKLADLNLNFLKTVNDPAFPKILKGTFLGGHPVQCIYKYVAFSPS